MCIADNLRRDFQTERLQRHFLTMTRRYNPLHTCFQIIVTSPQVRGLDSPIYHKQFVLDSLSNGGDHLAWQDGFIKKKNNFLISIWCEIVWRQVLSEPLPSCRNWEIRGINFLDDISKNCFPGPWKRHSWVKKETDKRCI